MAKLYNIVMVGSNAQLENQSSTLATPLEKIILASKLGFDENPKTTEIDKTCQAAIRKASTYAYFARTQEVYVSKATRTEVTPYYIALADWFGAPKVLEIDVDNWTGEIGQTIRVKARDNLRVARVSVVIRDGNDQILEIGEAVQSEAGSAWWSYTTRSRVKMKPFPIVEAIAQDLAGNRDYFVIS
jgi:hypothetical protein